MTGRAENGFGVTGGIPVVHESIGDFVQVAVNGRVDPGVIHLNGSLKPQAHYHVHDGSVAALACIEKHVGHCLRALVEEPMVRVQGKVPRLMLPFWTKGWVRCGIGGLPVGGHPTGRGAEGEREGGVVGDGGVGTGEVRAVQIGLIGVRHFLLQNGSWIECGTTHVVYKVGECEEVVN